MAISYATSAGKKLPSIMRVGKNWMADLIDGFGYGVGNVYLVVQSANTYVYTKIWNEYQNTYRDGSAVVHTTIASALTATVANRNDYVILMPDSTDYDITATLTLNKKCVHLLCPAGIANAPGATNAARIHQTGAYAALTISGQSVEVAGLFIKGYADKTGIEISAAAHACNIHNNFVGLATTSGSATAYGIHGTGESSNLIISDNYVTVYSPTASQTIGGGIVLDNGTRAIIDNNIVTTGGFAQTMSVGIGCGGAQIICKDNVLCEMKSGSPASSTFTLGLSVGGDTAVVGNKVMMTQANIANALSGSHNDMECLNYGSDAGSGGVTALS